MIIILNYKMGNSGSIKNMLKRIGYPSVISSDIAEIKNARKLILPGVGSFDNGMKNLADLGLMPVLNQKVLHERTPILGICLGMQLMTRRSEEGNLPGLGWIDAQTVKFHFDNGLSHLKIPHMGWNFLVKNAYSSHLFNDIHENPRFYFVHSYHAVCNKESNIIGQADYGYHFTAAFQNDNILGVQFHPEKSHKYGMKVLKNFVENF